MYLILSDLRHLLHHTSGIRDWPGTLVLGGRRFDDVISFSEI
jgi:CubicO group peptidase (beta-lactamase class C family)